MIAPALPPVPRVDLTLSLGGAEIDLRCRALVAAAIPAPRFGRESEVVASLRAARQAGADLVEASLPAGLIGPAARRGDLPIAVRAASIEAAAAARGAGASLLLLRAELVAQVAAAGWAAALLVDGLGDLAAGRQLAERHGLPVAIDTYRLRPVDALAVESAAISAGCRIVISCDVRRTRRVVATVGALLAARRAAGNGP